MNSEETQELMIRIEDEISKYEDPTEALNKYYRLIYQHGYIEIFSHNLNLKSCEFLDILRNIYEDKTFKDPDEKAEYILKAAHFKGVCERYDVPSNILVVNENMKFTFLNFSKNDVNILLKDGKRKMRRQYEDKWNESDEKAQVYIYLVR